MPVKVCCDVCFCTSVICLHPCPPGSTDLTTSLPPFPLCTPLQVQLKRRGDDEKYTARVLAIGTECDVALLTGGWVQGKGGGGGQGWGVGRGQAEWWC